jgi:hypothetical protein
VLTIDKTLKPGYALTVEFLITVEATTHELVKLMSAEHPTCNRKSSQSTNLTNNPGVTTGVGVMRSL